MWPLNKCRDRHHQGIYKQPTGLSLRSTFVEMTCSFLGLKTFVLQAAFSNSTGNAACKSPNDNWISLAPALGSFQGCSALQNLFEVAEWSDLTFLDACSHPDGLVCVANEIILVSWFARHDADFQGASRRDSATVEHHRFVLRSWNQQTAGPRVWTMDAILLGEFGGLEGERRRFP